MKRTLLKIAAFALTLSLGVGVSVGWQMYQWSLVPYEISPTPPWPLAPATPPRPKVADEITIVGGMDACGPQANYHTRELSDGTWISQSCENFPSEKSGARLVRSRLANAEIAERSPLVDEKGRVIGEKILTASPRVMRLELSEKTLCVTDAPSLHHLQLYEAGALRYSPKISGHE